MQTVFDNDCVFDCVDCNIKQVCYKYWKKRAFELASLYQRSTEERLKLKRELAEKQADIDLLGLCIDAFTENRQKH